MSEPLTPEERAALRLEHRRNEVLTPDDHVDAFCRLCYLWDEGWPCPTIRLLDEVEAAWAAVERAER